MWPFKSRQDPEKTCRQCHYFNEYVFPDRLLPDKTVIPGGISRWECSRGNFDLKDLAACELFKYDSDWQKRIPFPPLPAPPKNGSSVQRKV